MWARASTRLLARSTAQHLRVYRVRAAASAAMAEHTPANSTPRTVLTYWFAYFDQARMSVWYGGGAEADARCAAFAPLIRTAASKALGWAVSTEGRLATVILLDQLARGAFRGTPEAFAGDEEARAAARAAYAAGDHLALSVAEQGFLLLPLMHSEQLADQEECLSRARALAAAAPELSNTAFTLQYAEAHEAVVRRFGHFPHRNAAMGRETTAEERAWLDSPECPGWAKSQG